MGGESRVRLRLPTLEYWASTHGGALASEGRALLPQERTTAARVFQSSVDLDLIRIAEADVVNAPTTLGNVIRVRPGQTMPDRTLIHEVAHVWLEPPADDPLLQAACWRIPVAS